MMSWATFHSFPKFTLVWALPEGKLPLPLSEPVSSCAGHTEPVSGVRLCLWVGHFSLSRCSILWLPKVEESLHLDQFNGPCRNLVPGSQEDAQEEVILRCAFLNQQRFSCCGTGH